MGIVKTTVDLPDSLFHEAKACAESRGVSFRQIIEEGLRAVIRSSDKVGRFRLRDGSFGDHDIRTQKNWTEIRETIYQGRGE